MENSSICGSSVAEGKNSEATCDSNSTLGDHRSVDKLNARLSDNLKISAGNRTNNTIDVKKVRVDGYYLNKEVEDDDEEEDDDEFSEDALLEQMGYGKSEPKRDFIDQEEVEEDEDEEEDLSEEAFLAQMGYLKNEPPKHEPITTPIADLNLVSAFKGSREKQGKPKPAKESRVSWAPDVYDPIPKSDDHFVMNKTERHKNEHKVKGAAGKNRQKSAGKWGGASDDLGVGGVGGGKGGKGGGKKENVAAGKDKVKKYGDKKGKKRGGGGGGGGSKYSNSGEY